MEDEGAALAEATALVVAIETMTSGHVRLLAQKAREALEGLQRNADVLSLAERRGSTLRRGR